MGDDLCCVQAARLAEETDAEAVLLQSGALDPDAESFPLAHQDDDLDVPDL